MSLHRGSWSLGWGSWTRLESSGGREASGGVALDGFVIAARIPVNTEL
jgi:hypothetical protein